MSDKETVEEKRRVVAVVGRPNVGKSAIFNRIASKRIAIVHDQAGVTRDRLVREVTWHNESFELIDTGGVNLQNGDMGNAIEAGIIDQVVAALADAATAILTVDVQVGLTPVDEEVARLVRKADIPCFVAVNKCDLPSHEAHVAEFSKLGFPLFPVSAQHDRGFDSLMSSVIATLPDTVEETVENPLKVAIVGRPNAGKSSYINRLLRQSRVIVSDVAGTTRDSIEVPFTIGSGARARHYRLIDTAGMRHVHSIDSAVERFSHFRSEEAVRNADVVVLVMDAEVGPTVQDKRIAALIAKENKSCVLIVNKWDKAHDLLTQTAVTETQYEPALREQMPFMAHCPLVFISAKSGYNVRRSIDVIDNVAAQTMAKLPTGMLNRVLADAAERIQPPSRGRKHFKFYYATQTGNAPTRIRIFVNDAKIPGANYTNYLIKSIRAAFGLEGTPVVLNYRERIRPELADRIAAAEASENDRAEAGQVNAAPAARRSAPRTPADGAKQTKLRGKPARIAAAKRKASANPGRKESKPAKAAKTFSKYPSRSSARKTQAKNQVRTKRRK